MNTRRVRYWLGWIAGLAFTAAGLLWWFWPRLAPPEPGSTLVLALHGDLPERLAPTPLPDQASLLARWLRLPDGRVETPLSMLEIAQVLQAAARDPRIVRLRLEPAGLRAGWAKLEELRTWIAAFARSGKPVDCYLRAPGMKEYFVASAARRIAIAPSGWLNLRGFRAEVISFKGALDKLGVVAEIEAIGRYKDAGDSVTRESMSPHTREVLDSFLDARLASWTQAVAAGRRKTPAEVARVLDDGPFLAARARDLGLVDALEFAPPTEQTTPAASYRWLLTPSGRTRVAVVIVDGDIGAASSRELRASLAAVALDKTVRGVIVRVDSPGGEVAASDEMLDQLVRLRQRLPVVFSFSDVAASGGYALALTGDPIHASPGTVTGSIGVLFGKVDLSGLYAKLGVRKELLTRGQQATIDSEVRPLGVEGRRRLRAALQTMYDGFVDQVARARHLDPARVAVLAEGRAWLGADAQRHGLIDAVDGWDGALASLKRRIGLRATDEVDLALFPARDSWLDRAASGDVLPAVLGETLGPVVGGNRWLSGDGLGSSGAILRRLFYQIAIE